VTCDPAGGAGVAPYGPGGMNGNGYVADAGCCGVGCGNGVSTTATMSYVGAGGDYIQETSYKYVGRGAGEFGVLHVPTGVRNNCCCILIPLLLLLLLLPFLYMLFSASSNVTTTPLIITPAPTPMPTPAPPPFVPPPIPTPPVTTPPPPPTTTSHYDCNAGAEYTWSSGKKVFCCLSVHKGCPTTPAPTTTLCPFNCMAGYNDLGPFQWVKGWSGEKKIFCCRTARRGCPSELPPPSGIPQGNAPPEPDTFQYDCNAGYHNCPKCLVRQWSPAKLAYCCKTTGKGCNVVAR